MIGLINEIKGIVLKIAKIYLAPRLKTTDKKSFVFHK